ncbi:hypothetical protein C8T65DRAFT_635244 [Cerioporus squamosus]|nr:hypothetical protein C8T65DRAFT_635244 [Cerioporus squamosus]
MVARCSSTPNHPSRAGPISANIDRITLPRAYLQSGKLRGRKAMRKNPYKHPAIKDSIFTSTSDPTSQTSTSSSQRKPRDPQMPYVTPVPPLVDPQYWRSLPRTLERPPIGEINPANIASADPSYAGVPPDQLRDGFPFCGIRPIAPYNGEPELFVSAPTATLGDHYDFILMDVGLAAQPTHAFGIFPTFSAAQDARCTPHQLPMAFPQRRRVTLNPTHGALWAAYCSKLPALPYAPMQIAPGSPGTKDSPATSIVRLPLVPLPLPFPPGFFFIMRYIYTRVPWHFIAEMLLPVDQQGDVSEKSPQLKPWAEFFDIITVVPETEKNFVLRELHPAAVDKFGALLAGRYARLDLCRLARNVWGTYQNAVYLGFVDEKLWEAIEFSWASVLKALEISDPGP